MPKHFSAKWYIVTKFFSVSLRSSCPFLYSSTIVPALSFTIF